MILDVLENTYRYTALHKGFAEAFAFLARADLHALAEGKYTIDGDHVFAIVAKDPGRSKAKAQLETHEAYIDIQCILAGIDEMGWKPRQSCKQPAGAYDPETDLQFFTDEPDAWLPVHSGAFAIFFPEDAHMPLISPSEIYKVIIKVAVDQ